MSVMKVLLYNVLLVVNGNAAGDFLPAALKCSVAPSEDDAQNKRVTTVKPH